jgi:hypothetical protein
LPERFPGMGTSNDRELNDEVLGSEIELLADLIDAASHACSPLNPDQIDAVLGVCPRLSAEGPDSGQSPKASR